MCRLNGLNQKYPLIPEWNIQLLLGSELQEENLEHQDPEVNQGKKVLDQNQNLEKERLNELWFGFCSFL